MGPDYSRVRGRRPELLAAGNRRLARQAASDAYLCRGRLLFGGGVASTPLSEAGAVAAFPHVRCGAHPMRRRTMPPTMSTCERPMAWSGVKGLLRLPPASWSCCLEAFASTASRERRTSLMSCSQAFEWAAWPASASTGARRWSSSGVRALRSRSPRSRSRAWWARSSNGSLRFSSEMIRRGGRRSSCRSNRSRMPPYMRSSKAARRSIPIRWKGSTGTRFSSRRRKSSFCSIPASGPTRLRR